MGVAHGFPGRERTITASIVAYNTSLHVLQGLLQDLSVDKSISRIILVDNSEDGIYGETSTRFAIERMRPGRNIGYGSAHNMAFEVCSPRSDYHVVLNPDIRIPAGTIARLSQFMETHADAGLVMPRIAYPDGATQHLCKLLPGPWDLIVRRFLPVQALKKKAQDRLEMKTFFGYEKVVEVPWLSGSFMFLRTSVAKKVGLFDSRFFLYMEDADLSRRLGSVSRNMYFPEVTVFHGYQKESYKSLRAVLLHIVSAVKYFNKWGWIFDDDRRRTNRRILRALRRP